MSLLQKRKRRFIFCLVLLSLFALVGCKKEQEEGSITYKVYYVNHDRTALQAEQYITRTTDADAVLSELITALSTVPEKLQYVAPLAEKFSLLDYRLQDGQLILNFDAEYKNQELIAEILCRASIVRTLSQVEGVQYVSFLVENEPLTDASGDVVGVMSADQFIDNAGNEINTYEKVRLQLYFADEDGTGLKAVTRTKVYSSNISLERLVVEELIAGPSSDDSGMSGGEKAYAVVNSAAKIVSVNVRDGICYVNLDSSFLNRVGNVSPLVTIYAITDSLAELSGVNKVQFMINGETNVNFGESVSLSTPFERNLDIVD